MLLLKTAEKRLREEETDNNEPFKKILPDAETIEEGIKVYKSFYTPDQEKKFGVVAIEVEKYQRCAT